MRGLPDARYRTVTLTKKGQTALEQLEYWTKHANELPEGAPSQDDPYFPEWIARNMPQVVRLKASNE